MTLHLVATEVDRGRLHRYAGRRGMMPGVFDEGFALHCMLGENIGPGLLQPFRLIYPQRSATATLYAYSELNGEDIVARAASVSEPEVAEMISGLKSKPMPASWTKGQTFGFEVKLRPVRRSHSEAGRIVERDAFVNNARCDPAREISRSDVYAAWLVDRFDKAVSFDAQPTLRSFQRVRVVRRRGDRRGIEGPDVVMRGVLRVEVPLSFAQLLAKGIGRHRAYGYGMLLLRPPPRHA